MMVGLLGFLFLQGKQDTYLPDKAKIEQEFLYNTRALDQIAQDQHRMLDQLSDLRKDFAKMTSTVDELSGAVKGASRGK